MYKIALINMPFANLNFPSIALTQLKAVLEKEHAGKVSTDIFYLNHDFVDLLGLDGYREIAGSINSLNSGIGEWIFRPSAFPELPDNSEAYFHRYFPRRTEEGERLKQLITKVQREVDPFIEGLVSKYGLDGYDLVGFTSMFMQNLASFAMARHVKKKNPDVLVVMGGANCESPMGQELVKNVAALDYVFSGPALKSFPLFVRHRLNGEPEKCLEIAGIFGKENALAVQGRATIGEELAIDELVTLDYDPFMRLVEERYRDRRMQVTLPFETSRGCWWGERAHCTFCGLNGLTMNYRAMNPDGAVNLISSLFRYSSQAVRLESVDNILPKSYMEAVFPRLKTPESMYIFYEVKADLTEQDMEVLSNARVKVVQPGIEALATSTLKLMKKGTTSFNNIKFLINCLIYDIYPVWNLLVGFPGEGAEVYRAYLRDIPKLVHLPPPTGVYPVRFDRYSPYFNQAKEYGLNLRPLPFYELTYPFEGSSLGNLAYYFGDQNYDSEYFRTVVEHITQLQQAVEAWKQKWNGTPPPMLYSEARAGGGRIIRDTRAGAEEIHEPGETAWQILDALSRRKSISELASGLGHVGETELKNEVQSLKEKGLVFEEHELYMSLVLSQKTRDGLFSSVKGH
ncbi:MAG TPA: RiPP maturation radical SAM C-methyltransferase [Pyrinomonadaceae bacterium]|nr:RiPP maturation radical SAM C-methyltransferase [Pyrinomonadaceae bacterium]